MPVSSTKTKAVRYLLPLLLAGLAVAAKPPAPVTNQGISDVEVTQYLKGGEFAEWSRARQLYDAGKTRAAQGKGISEIKRTPLIGSGGETPEQARQRGLTIQREGEEEMARANLTLNRLRALAAARHADQTKAVSAGADILSQSWREGILLAAVRGVKAARDAGATQHHILGVWSYDVAGQVSANQELVDELRAAWKTAQAERDYLQPLPAQGYALAPGAEAASSMKLASELNGPAAAGEQALVWAEVFILSEEAAIVLVRVADAHSFKLLFSEVFLTSPKGEKVNLTASLNLRDDRSFLPRLGANASWRLGYPTGSPPLAAALLRHVCHRLGQVDVWADDTLLALGISQIQSRANAQWSIKPVMTAPLGERAWDLASMPTTEGAKAIPVGRLTLRIVTPVATPPKPAGR